nr:uncharacterized protein LOC127316018 [Lolium perenne]
MEVANRTCSLFCHYHNTFVVLLSANSPRARLTGPSPIKPGFGGGNSLCLCLCRSGTRPCKDDSVRLFSPAHPHAGFEGQKIHPSAVASHGAPPAAAYRYRASLPPPPLPPASPNLLLLGLVSWLGTGDDDDLKKGRSGEHVGMRLTLVPWIRVTRLFCHRPR